MNDGNQKKQGDKMIKIILIVCAAFIVLIVVFWLGMIVGFYKARFSYQWEKNYSNLFAKPDRMVPPDFRGRNFMDAHNAVGTIISVSTSTLIIKDDSGMEKSVVIDSRTLIRRGQETIVASQLAGDDRVVVLGAPSSTGQIEARLIRVLLSNN